jgi:hypothetical protein
MDHQLPLVLMLSHASTPTRPACIHSHSSVSQGLPYWIDSQINPPLSVLSGALGSDLCTFTCSLFCPHRGYPIEELAERGHFLEVAYLVLFGDLPTTPQLATFTEAVMRHSALPTEVSMAQEGYAACGKCIYDCYSQHIVHTVCFFAWS